MNKNSIKYLFTGSLIDYGTCEARRSGLEKIGRTISTLSHEKFFSPINLLGILGKKFNSLQTLTGFGPSILLYNQALLRMVKDSRPTVLWVEKGQFIYPSTLSKIKDSGVFLVCYNTDDIAYAPNGWRLHQPGIKFYDKYFTTNISNISELKSLGAKSVSLTQLGYNQNLFFPKEISIGERKRLGASVGFIGHWEPSTEDVLFQELSRGTSIRIRGKSWVNATPNKNFKKFIESSFLSVNDYTSAIVATKINLGINSFQSRNKSSGRTFEIPASGGFLLAQRTHEHLSFFDEGIEAEFFDSSEELHDKIKFYLANDIARKKIADFGRLRCVNSGYSYQNLMVGLIDQVEKSL